jgi:hypothetical protein
MSLTNQQEHEILAHISNNQNPHNDTMSQLGIKTSDDIVEGIINKFAIPYSLDPAIQLALENKYGIPINLYKASTSEVFNLIFDLLSRG